MLIDLIGKATAAVIVIVYILGLVGAIGYGLLWLTTLL